MSEKFKNKYTIKSTRLEGYNYSLNGMYFVTICTKDREEFFSSIRGVLKHCREYKIKKKIGDILKVNSGKS